VRSGEGVRDGEGPRGVARGASANSEHTVRQASKKNSMACTASELYRLSDRRMSAKLVPTFADSGCHVVSVTDSYGRILRLSRPGGRILQYNIYIPFDSKHRHLEYPLSSKRHYTLHCDSPVTKKEFIESLVT
jgi:hypothetical protein